jgi:hypothetical protein
MTDCENFNVCEIIEFSSKQAQMSAPKLQFDVKPMATVAKEDADRRLREVGVRPLDLKTIPWDRTDAMFVASVLQLKPN